MGLYSTNRQTGGKGHCGATWHRYVEVADPGIYEKPDHTEPLHASPSNRHQLVVSPLLAPQPVAKDFE